MNLEALATDRVFSAAAALRVGICGGDLRRGERDGECHRLFRGWYAVGPVGEARAEHRLRTVALSPSSSGGLRRVITPYSCSPTCRSSALTSTSFT